MQRTPGGDFGWLKKNYNYIGHPNGTEWGESHGHSIVAADNGYVADDINTTAPGGTFSSSQLGCTSCHDPHSSIRRTSDTDGPGIYVKGGLGKAVPPIIGSGSYNNSANPAAGQAVGAYRLLRGLGDSKDGATFTGVAIAVAPSTYNQTEATNQVRVAYGTSGINTWGNWCASCHPNMSSSGHIVHPTDQSLGSGVANTYNAYKMSGDLTGLTASSFSSLVPFVENTGDISALKGHAKNDGSYMAGPGSTDKVTCITCHRAHASGWTGALRWNMEGEFMIYNSLFPGSDNTASSYARGHTAAETQAAYYDRPVTAFASYQRVLCNKCHAQD